jgi:hypothetical protein
MKRSLSLTLQILFTLGICLSAFLGCGSGGSSYTAPPPEFRWRGPTTNFSDTAPARPNNYEDCR